MDNAYLDDLKIEIAKLKKENYELRLKLGLNPVEVKTKLKPINHELAKNENEKMWNPGHLSDYLEKKTNEVFENIHNKFISINS